MKKDNREQTTIRLSEEMKERLQQEADKRGISLNAFVNLIIREHLEKNK